MMWARPRSTFVERNARRRSEPVAPRIAIGVMLATLPRERFPNATDVPCLRASKLYQKRHDKGAEESRHGAVMILETAVMAQTSPSVGVSLPTRIAARAMPASMPVKIQEWRGESAYQ